MTKNEPEPESEVYGPRRRAPRYYTGTHIGKYRSLYPDVETNKNGSIPGIRNKAARRIIRKAFRARMSKVERGIRLAWAMRAQAREVIGDEHYEKSPSARSRMARRLYEMELKIHQPQPSRPTRAQRRAYARKHGGKDAIAQLVEKMAEKQP